VKHSFAIHLKEAREAAGISQFELAQRTGLTQRQIGDIEAGYRKPTWDDAVKLIEACGGKITVQKPKMAADSVPSNPCADRR
jgi:transcriptional regulator with XRE-family HTH domain